MAHIGIFVLALGFALGCPALASAQLLPDIDLEIDLDDLELGVGIGDVDVNVDLPDLPPLPDLPVVDQVPGLVEGIVGGPNDADIVDQVLDQALVRQAVRENRALPLDELLKVASHNLVGIVIDVRLMQLRGPLVYEVKMLDPRGMVQSRYFVAATGDLFLAAGR